MLIDHMAKGHSFKSFCAVVDVWESTLYDWCDRYPLFNESKKIGREKGRLKYEQIVLAGGLGKIKNANSTLLIWFGKNVHGWRDKSKEEIQDENNSKIIIQMPDNDRSNN